MKYYQPIINSGTFAGELPQTFPSSFFAFESEQECLDWIAKNKYNLFYFIKADSIHLDKYNLVGNSILSKCSFNLGQ